MSQPSNNVCSGAKMNVFLKIMIGVNVVMALIFYAPSKQEKANWHLLLATLASAVLIAD